MCDPQLCIDYQSWCFQLCLQVSSSSKAKKKRKEKPKPDVELEELDVPDLASGVYKMEAFELKDVSELDTPKLSSCGASNGAMLDVMKSTEGFSELPEDEVSFPNRTPATSKRMREQAPAADVSSRDSTLVKASVTEQLVSAASISAPIPDDVYSSNDFASVSASVTASNRYSSEDNMQRRDIHGLYEPDLSAISYTDSDNHGKSEMLNIKSLSELGSSVDDLDSVKEN